MNACGRVTARWAKCLSMGRLGRHTLPLAVACGVALGAGLPMPVSAQPVASAPPSFTELEAVQARIGEVRVRTEDVFDTQRPEGSRGALPMGERAAHPDARQRHRERPAVQTRGPGLGGGDRRDRTSAARGALSLRRADPPGGLPGRRRRHRGGDARQLVAHPGPQCRPGRRRKYERHPAARIQLPRDRNDARHRPFQRRRSLQQPAAGVERPCVRQPDRSDPEPGQQQRR